MIDDYDPHRHGPELPDTNGLSLGSLALFIVLSAWIAIGAYYGVRYLFSGLPKITVMHHAPR